MLHRAGPLTPFAALLCLALTTVLACAGCVGLPPGTPAPSVTQPALAETAPANATAVGAGDAQTPQAGGPGVPGGTLHYGLTLAVSGIDPHVNASSELGIPLSSVYDTLVAQDKAGQFHPDLATGWQISTDGLTYSFKLRQDVKFQDGTPFNAAAVVRNLQRVTDPATHSQKAVFLLGPFDHAEAVDNYTVKIVLKQAYAPLLDGLSQVYLGMASPAALDKWGGQYQLHQVGTGPYRMVSYQQGQSLVLERNPDYAWAPETRTHGGPGYLERIEFRFYGDPATRLPALLSGQADVMGEMPAQDAAQLSNNGAYRVYPVAIPGQSVSFFLNTKLAPLDDLRVRQALLYGTDRAALVQAVFGPTSPVASGPLAKVTRSADPALAGLYGYDAKKAADLLAQAGWTERGADGILTRGGQRLALKGILQSWGELAKIGTILQAQWRQLGVDVQWDTLSYPAALDASRKGTYHLMPSVFSGTDPDLLRTYFASSQIGGFNWSRVSDPAVDSWLEEAARTTDWAQRGPLYAKVQQRVMEQAWILPIRDQVNLNAASTRVQGLTYDVQGWWPVLYDVWLGPPAKP
jgi:peptide/nickel transport system substrate-binding protein